MGGETDGTCVLLLGGRGDGTGPADECDDLLRRDRDGIAELLVSYAAAGTGAHVSEATDRRPARKGIVSVGDEARSATAEGGPDFSGPVAVDAIADPGDLRSVGISVSRFCERWADTEVVVCFDSLGDLLDHASDDAVFRFVTLLTKRLSAADATAHFHLDPDAHDDSVVSTFASIFDRIVRPEEAADFAVEDGDADGDVVEASDEEIRRLADEFEDDGFAVVEGRAGDAEDSDDPGDAEVREASDDEIADIFE